MSRLTQNIIANFTGKTWATVLSLFFVPLYLKFMGIEAYGLVGILVSLQAVSARFDMGVGVTVNRELARLSGIPDKACEMRNLVRTLEIVYWGGALLIALIGWRASSFLAHYWVKADVLSIATVQEAVMLMGGIVASAWTLRLYSGGLQGLQRQVLVNTIEMSVATLRGIGSVLILWQISPTIQAFFLWQMFISLLHVFLKRTFLWKILPKSGLKTCFQKTIFLNTWRFAAGMSGISMTALILSQIDKILLSKILPLEMLGYYTLATAIPLTLYRFITPISSAVFPRFSQLISLGEQSKLEELYHKSCQVMSVIILPFTIVVALFSSEILFFWTRNSLIVANTHLLTSLMIIRLAVNGLGQLPYTLQLAYGWTTLRFYTNIGSLIVLIPGVYFCTIQYGVVGTAIVLLMIDSGRLLIFIKIMYSRLLKGGCRRWYLNHVGYPLFAGLLVALFWRIWIPTAMSNAMMLIYLGGVSITTFVASAMATRYTRFRIIQMLSKL